jgi:histidine triad (HIT) family protein
MSSLSQIWFYFETAFRSIRAWSIWSYAYVAMAAVVMVSHPALGSHHQQGGSRVGSARDGNNVVLKDGRAAFQSVFHIDLRVVPRQNGDKLSFAKGMLLRRDPDREKTGRTLREALEKIDATE